MNRVIFYAVLTILVGAWKAESCEHPIDTLYDRMVVEIIRKKDDTTYSNFATGLFVYSYRKECQSILVSNRHVLKTLDRLFLRINCISDGGVPRVDTVAIKDYVNCDSAIQYPSDSSVDMAACFFCRIPKNWDISTLPKSMVKPAEEIVRGSEVFYLGFPMSISFRDKSIPLYRSGFIALDKHWTVGGYYLVDGFVIPGSSGSPVFDCSGSFVGIAAAHLLYRPNEQNTEILTSKRDTLRGFTQLHSGLSGIIPIDRVIEFIEEIAPEWGAK